MGIYNKKPIKRIITYFWFMLISTNTYSQIDYSSAKSNFWQNVSFGGAVGLSFGNGFFSGTLAPSAIYNFNDHFAAGIGLNATYAKEKDFYSATILGGSVIGLYSPIPEIQISAEFEELNVNRKYEFTQTVVDENYWYPALFLGAGFRTGPVTLGLRYDVLYERNKSIYANAYVPFIRVYF